MDDQKYLLLTQLSGAIKKLQHKRKAFLALVVMLWGISISFASQEAEGIDYIEELLKNKEFEKAAQELETQINELKALNLMDSLVQFPYYLARIEAEFSDLDTANEKALAFMESLKERGASARQQQEAIMSLVYFLGETGQVRKSKDITLEALELAKVMDGATEEEIGFIEYNLGIDAYRLGNLSVAIEYLQTAVQKYESFADTSPGRLADGYNALGAMFWLSSQPDSARIFYQKSIGAIALLDADTVDKAFRTAITLSNVALIEHSRLQTNRAIASLERTMDLHQFVIRKTTDNHQRSRAELFRLRAMANLASFYNSIGNYRLALEMITFVYNTYRETLHPGDPEIYKALIRVGEAQMSLRNYPKAHSIFRQAIDMYESMEGEDIYWRAVAYANLAEAETHIGSTANTEIYFRNSKHYFEKALGNIYNRTYLNMLIRLAEFLVQNNQQHEAIFLVKSALELIESTDKEQQGTMIRHFADLANVYFMAEDVVRAENTISMAFEIIERKALAITSASASLQLERQIPELHIMKAKIMLHNGGNEDTLKLKQAYKELLHSKEILERRARYFTTGDNINALMDENRELFELLKQVSFELYQLTAQKDYLNNLIDYHEAGVFQRIRLRFLLRNSEQFHGIPQDIVNREWEITGQFTQIINEDVEIGTAGFSTVFKAWEDYLELLRSDYPQYYQMRFGRMENNLPRAQNALPPETTLVRYFYVKDQLKALVISDAFIQLVNITSNNIDQTIARLNTFLPETTELSLLHELYKTLWEPISRWVTTHHVIILPDRGLFNLSFETLVKKNVSSYKDLIEHSLLAKHAISYNFSLAMVQPAGKNTFFNNFTAFVPGFTDSMKEQYNYLSSQSGSTDNEYLHLLPQPFTLKAATEIKKTFGGKVFREEHSTKNNFIHHAAGNRILHIGTHAEANNISPMFSRLIFAKDIHKGLSTGSNHLYAHEIYHYNLASQLTVLTACETGLPQHMPGEGMTSLAHAFFYAGSESLLMSLWKIDEHASAMIIAAFYRYLAQGDNKAEALRKARLDYLSQARGRTMAPVYWAGIVLLGDTSPIAISKKTYRPYLIAILGVSFLLLLVLLMKRKDAKTA